MPMFTEPRILRAAEHDDECAGARFEAQRLEFQVVHPRVPASVLFAVDVHVWRAVFVCEGQFGFFEGGKL